MPEDAGEARNATAAATSSGATGRPSAAVDAPPGDSLGPRLLQALARDEPGRDPDDPDPARTQLVGRGRDEVVQGGLGDGVGGVGRGRARSLDRPDRHRDPAGPHPGGGAVQQGGRGAQAAAVHRVPGRRVEVGPRRVVLREGVEDDDVDRPEGVRAGVEEPVAGAVEVVGALDGEVGVEEGRPPPGALDGRGHGLGPGPVAPEVDPDVVSGSGEGHGQGRPEAAARPGDEGAHRIRPIGSSRVSAVISVAYDG